MSVFFLLLIILTPKIKAAEGDIWLTSNQTELGANQTFDLQLYIDTGGKNLGAFDFFLDFNSALLTIDTANGENGIDKGVAAENYTILANIDNINTGHYRFSGICAQNCANNDNAQIAIIHLLTKNISTDNTVLSLRLNKLTDDYGHDLDNGNLLPVNIGIDATAPIRSSASPQNTLAANTSETTISLTTDEDAICKYATTPNTDYSSMTNTFTTTNGTVHSTVINNLTNGNSYNYYVRCIDNHNNKNLTDLIISFSVNSPANENENNNNSGGTNTYGGKNQTAVIISNGAPSENLSAETKKIIISINTNEPSICRYATEKNVSYENMSGIFNITGTLSHSTTINNLTAGQNYKYYIKCKNNGGLVNNNDYIISFNVNQKDNKNNSSNNKKTNPTLQEKIKKQTKTILKIKEEKMYDRLKGKILLKVEDNGRAYYIHPLTKKGFYLGRPADAFEIMREQSIGIKNNDLEKIPFGLERLVGQDSDKDGLPDLFENAIGTDPNKKDTDNDGYDDKKELASGYSPTGKNKYQTNNAFAKKKRR